MAGDKELGERIRWHRNARGLNQQQLADALGVTAKTVGNWELGKVRPKVGAIESVLGVRLEEPGQESDPVLDAINASALSEGSKEILRGTYRNLLRDEELRRGA